MDGEIYENDGRDGVVACLVSAVVNELEARFHNHLRVEHSRLGELESMLRVRRVEGA